MRATARNSDAYMQKFAARRSRTLQCRPEIETRLSPRASGRATAHCHKCAKDSLTQLLATHWFRIHTINTAGYKHDISALDASNGGSIELDG